MGVIVVYMIFRVREIGGAFDFWVFAREGFTIACGENEGNERKESLQSAFVIALWEKARLCSAWIGQRSRD